jgi:hypothetical protein
MASKKTRDDVITFFETLTARRFSDAGKVLNELRGKNFGNKEYKDGYIMALEGLLLSSRTGDDRDFYNRAEFETQKALNNYKKEFRSFVKEGVNSPYDTGFFQAWSDLIQYRLDNQKKS